VPSPTGLPVPALRRRARGTARADSVRAESNLLSLFGHAEFPGDTTWNQ